MNFCIINKFLCLSHVYFCKVNHLVRNFKGSLKLVGPSMVEDWSHSLKRYDEEKYFLFFVSQNIFDKCPSRSNKCQCYYQNTPLKIFVMFRHHKSCSKDEILRSYLEKMHDVKNNRPGVCFSIKIQKSIVQSMEHYRECFNKYQNQHQIVNSEHLNI